MSGFTAIDLSKTPPPAVVEPLDYEVILQAMKADLLIRDPELMAVALESEPLIKLLEVCAYRELLLRQRVNDAAHGVMLAYAGGTDLDNLAALFGVERQVMDPGDPEAIPPVPPTLETDERLRYRTQLSLEGHSTAGPVGSYEFHAISADPLVKDVDVASPVPGEVVVSVLSTVGNGTPAPALLTAVDAKLNDRKVRPLTDRVTVQAAEIVSYRIKADLILYHGPDEELVRQEAIWAVTAYTQQHHKLGHDITLSGLYAALHRTGVQRVVLINPTTDLLIAPQQAAYCTDQVITMGGRDE